MKQGGKRAHGISDCLGRVKQGRNSENQATGGPKQLEYGKRQAMLDHLKLLRKIAHDSAR